MKCCKKIVVGVAIIALLVGIGVGIKTLQSTATPPVTATVLSHPRALSDFELVDDRLRPFTLEQLKNHWSFVFFGFSHCPTLCPTTMSEMAKVFNELPKNTKYPPQMIFITVDPARDTPEVLHRYVAQFNPDFIGVTGDEATLAKLRKELGILAMAKAPDQVKGEDTFDHSATVILLDPNGDFHAVFSAPHSVESIVKDYQAISAGN